MDSTLARYESDRLASLSADRRRASLRALRDLRALCDGAELARSDADAVRRVLAAWTAVGASASTVRKQRAMLLAFFVWSYERGHIDGDKLLAVRAVRAPVKSSREAAPRPYRPTELRALRVTLDERWPKLPDDEVWKWLCRFRDGRSPYSRVRSHVIRCQLDAVITLALHLGLRRREIFSLDIVTGHPDNDTVVVWGDDERTIARVRAVPATATVRAALVAWTDCRHAVAPDQRSLWLNFHAEPTCREPMRRETFNALLRTYVGPGWTLKRLRDAAAAGWVRAGLPLEHLRQLLGLATIEDTLPYARLVGGSLERRMVELDEHFCELVGPVTITDVAA
jgi:site-specific recombinase XerD